MRSLLILGLLAAPAGAADKQFFIGSFERLRVEGPFRVTVTTGRSPGARLTGDAARSDRVEVRLDGTTLVIRQPIGRHEGGEDGSATAVSLVLTTPSLASATVIGGGVVTVAGGRAPRLDLTVTGAGSIALAGALTEQATATVIGGGTITMAGRTGAARLLLNGSGTIDADGLEANEVTVRVDGPGETRARARYVATVTNIGLGRVAVAGTPRCVVRNDAGGPVACGKATR